VHLPRSAWAVGRASAAPGSLRAIAEAVGASADGLTIAELTARMPGIAQKTLEQGVRTLVRTQLLQWKPDARRGHERGPRRHYFLPQHTRHLLRELDALDPGAHPALRDLAGWLNRPAGRIAASPDSVVALDAALGAARDALGSRIPDAPPAPNSVRAILDAVGAVPNGATSAELSEIIPGIRGSNMQQRLAVLTQWGLLDSVADVQTGRSAGRRRRYLLPERTRQLLRDLDRSGVAEHPERARLARAFAVPTSLIPGQATTAEIAAALGALRAVTRARPAASAAQVPPTSLRGMLATIGAAANGITAVELTEATSGTSGSTIRRRLLVFAAWGLVVRERDNPSAGSAAGYVYRLTDDARLVLAELDRVVPADDVDQNAVDHLALLLGRSASLTAGARTTLEIQSALRAVREQLPPLES
jgi:DNA-binding HxlR family transcriptional regulator